MTAPVLYAVVLAAGGSRRLGSPKQLLVSRGKTLIRSALDQACAVCGDHVYVVLGAYHELVAAQLIGLPGERLINENWQSGMASSLSLAVGALPPDATSVLLMVCDQPRVTIAELDELVAGWQGSPDAIVASTYGGTLGVPAIFPRRCFASLMRLQGDEGAKSLLLTDPNVLRIPMPSAAFDVDDAESARQLD